MSKPNTVNTATLIHIKNSIENMTKDKHKQVLFNLMSISNKHAIVFNENTNGVLINLRLVPAEVITELTNYITYIKLQEHDLVQRESDKLLQRPI